MGTEAPRRRDVSTGPGIVDADVQGLRRVWIPSSVVTFPGMVTGSSAYRRCNRDTYGRSAEQVTLDKELHRPKGQDHTVVSGGETPILSISSRVNASVWDPAKTGTRKLSLGDPVPPPSPPVSFPWSGDQRGSNAGARYGKKSTGQF